MGFFQTEVRGASPAASPRIAHTRVRHCNPSAAHTALLDFSHISAGDRSRADPSTTSSAAWEAVLRGVTAPQHGALCPPQGLRRYHCDVTPSSLPGFCRAQTPHSTQTHTQHTTRPSYSLFSPSLPLLLSHLMVSAIHAPVSPCCSPWDRELLSSLGAGRDALPAPACSGLPAVADSQRALSSFHFLCNTPCEQLCCRCSRRREQGSRAPTGGAGAEAVPAARSSGTHPRSTAGERSAAARTACSSAGQAERDKRKQNPTHRHPRYSRKQMPRGSRSAHPNFGAVRSGTPRDTAQLQAVPTGAGPGLSPRSHAAQHTPGCATAPGRPAVPAPPGAGAAPGRSPARPAPRGAPTFPAGGSGAPLRAARPRRTLSGGGGVGGWRGTGTLIVTRPSWPPAGPGATAGAARSGRSHHPHRGEGPVRGRGAASPEEEEAGTAESPHQLCEAAAPRAALRTPNKAVPRGGGAPRSG